MATDYELYVLVIPEGARTNSGARNSANVSVNAILNQSGGEAQPISSDPTEQSISGIYAGEYAEKMATELQELGLNQAADGVPLAGRQGETPLDGYYAIESANVDPRSPQSDSLWGFDLTVAEQGRRESDFRAVRTTSPIPQVDNPFGSGSTAEVGIPAGATDVTWVDEETTQTAEPSLITTRAAERGDVDIYDARAAPFDSPTLIYDLPYLDEGEVDPRVWDERGVGSKLDGDGILQWAKVFSPSHEYGGERIIDNGLVRLRFDPGGSGLAAERWSGSWTDESLGASDWTLSSVDIRRIGFERVEARVGFADTTQSPTATYDLDVSVKRGWADPLWIRPPGAAAIPTGLSDLLDPIADTQTYDAVATQGLIDRAEVV
jgi:hypothetical protein